MKQKLPKDTYSRFVHHRVKDLQKAKDWLDKNGNYSSATNHLKRVIEIAEQNMWYTVSCQMASVLYRIEDDARGGALPKSTLAEIARAIEASERLSIAESSVE